MRSLSEEIVVTQAAGYQSADTVTVDGSIIDMQGYEGVILHAHLGDMTSGCVVNLKGQGASVNSGGSMADISGAATGAETVTATSHDSKTLSLDIYRPQQRYIRPRLLRGTQNGVVNAITATRYGAKKVPTGLSGDVVTKVVVAPSA